MNKLQYDSFYKFIVSVGAVLITAPIIGLYYLISSSYGVIISKQTYLNLSSVSLKFIENKENLLDIAFSVLPIAFFGLIFIGLICIGWGSFKWYNIQKTLDDSIRLDFDEKKYNYKKMTAAEIAEKVIKEETENQDSLDSSETSHPNLATEISKALSPQEIVTRILRVENLCYKLISKRLGRNYIVRQNIRVGSHEFDIVATSKKGNKDYLYEIKYWNAPRGVYKSAISKVFEKLKEGGACYEMDAQRDFQWVLLIVANTENLERIQKQFEQYFLQEKPEYNLVEIEYIDVKDLVD